MNHATSIYHHDYQLWLSNQITLLQQGAFSDLDVKHLIEEMEDMGISNRRALSSHLIILIAHLLKWQFQPEHRSSSWRGSIVEQRVQLEDVLEAAPSLKNLIPEVMHHIYPKALKIAVTETGMKQDKFPNEMPYTVEQLLNENYWPSNGVD